VEPRPDDDHFPDAPLQDVPQQLHDAVSVDGGGAWARLRVTIPLITPAILFNLVIGLVAALQTFTQAYVVTDGGPNNANLFLVFYIYREGFRNSNIGYASALSWGLFAMIAVLSAIVFTSAKRWVHYEGGER
jgi:multiple sugar transport system permease protein